MMYHGSGSYAVAGPPFLVSGQGTHHPLVTSTAPAAGPTTSRRRHHCPSAKGENTAFGLDSDDDYSISSNASSSKKSNDGGEGSQQSAQSSSRYTREWRRSRGHQQRQHRSPPAHYLGDTYPFQMKLPPNDLRNGSKWDTLSEEIWNKFVRSQQTEATFRKKMDFWKYLYTSIKSIIPRYGLYVVGSTMSGFGLESSDMDLCLYVRPEDDTDPRAHALFHLHYILEYIKKFDPKAEVIQAKVPILKFRDPRNGVQVDLNCNNVVGIRNTSLLNCFSKLDWRVRPLVAVAKLWARAHNINDARNRTLSSYSLTLMVINFLQCGTQPAILPRAGEDVPWSCARAVNRSALGELFCGFLRYYGTFPYCGAAVSVRCGARVPLAACRAHACDPHQWKLLCVEEPFNLSNTASSVYDPQTFEKIVNTFRESYKTLSKSLQLQDAWPQR